MTDKKPEVELKLPPPLYTANVVIPVSIYQDHRGIFAATSPMVKGLLVIGKERDEVLRKVPSMMEELTKAYMSK